MSTQIALDGFVPDKQLEELVKSGRLSCAGRFVVDTTTSRLYALEDALRILEHCGGTTDPYGYIGRVEGLRPLLKRGFVLSGSRIGLGRCVYEVEYGVLLHPIAGAEESGMTRAVG